MIFHQANVNPSFNPGITKLTGLPVTDAAVADMYMEAAIVQSSKRNVPFAVKSDTGQRDATVTTG